MFLYTVSILAFDYCMHYYMIEDYNIIAWSTLYLVTPLHLTVSFSKSRHTSLKQAYSYRFSLFVILYIYGSIVKLYFICLCTNTSVLIYYQFSNLIQTLHLVQALRLSNQTSSDKEINQFDLFLQLSA